ncbi:MAG: ribonuclease H-like domain-containing protein [Nitrospiraceae bacterium]
MLQSTFVFLKGIGDVTERRLWEDGVLHWPTFLRQTSIAGMSRPRKAQYDEAVASAMAHLQSHDALYFARCLKSRDHWRLFSTFRPRTLYLVIETNGGSPHEGDVTVVGLYSNGLMTSLVQGETLNERRLNEVFSQHDLLVTFFGSVFDVPYLRAKFPGLRCALPHFDLCFAARRLGLRGGLKYIEPHYDIERDSDVCGLDGWDAVRLWNGWQNGQSASLDLLLRYNAADTRNLEQLAQALYDGMVARYGPSNLPSAIR